MPLTFHARVLALLFVTLFTSHAAADDIRWRPDYAAARRESAATGRPLFVDIGAEACGWCKKLDATTFRDPAVAALVNARFVPVKIDADRTPGLAQVLGAEAYPTLVVAGPDGTVIERKQGYLDASAMRDALTRSLARVPAEPTPAAASPVVVAAADPWADARADIAAGLSSVYLERGTSLDREGRRAEAVAWVVLAAGMGESPAARAAAGWLARGNRGDR